MENLVEAGILRPATHATSVVCDGCEEACLETVEFIEAEDGALRAVVICSVHEDMAPVPVPLERLQQWALDLDGLARAVSDLSGASGSAEEIVPGRLWGLGRAQFDRRGVDLFLALGAARQDAPTVFGQAGRVREVTMPVVLVPGEVPVHPPFGPEAKVLSLVRMLSVDSDASLTLDRTEIEQQAAKRRAKRTHDVAPFPTPPGTKWEQVVIEFQSQEVVKITAGQVVDHKTFAEMGFADCRRRIEQPDQLWGVLRLMAQSEGRLAWRDDADIPPAKRPKVKQWIKDIRARLRAYFQIEDNPFKPYRQVRAYETKFVLRWSDHYRRSRR